MERIAREYNCLPSFGPLNYLLMESRADAHFLWAVLFICPFSLKECNPVNLSVLFQGILFVGSAVPRSLSVTTICAHSY